MLNDIKPVLKLISEYLGSKERLTEKFVIPEYQRQGIGHKLLEFFKEQNNDWKKIELVTPADKEKNINFYTKKCGFKIVSEEMDRTIRVFHFSLDKE